ncbi:MAG: hypothetical protein COB67_10140 [SAR324 cluster bacterium]|uniref:histidine kinase n=1 Tax=SAR324 cluster bacterium TaxID=2024889 RepID=A0A2A4SYB8_9DELT|nr:MAG: hypothetical protein COB67_10140 [SAR324 cluster bacterium]
MNLSSKLILSITVVILTGVPLLGFGVYQLTRNVIEDSIRTNQQSLAEQVIRTIDRTLYKVRQDIQVIAEDIVLKEFSKTSAGKSLINLNQKRLQKHLLLTGPWRHLFLVDIQGVIVTSTQKKYLASHINTLHFGRVAYESAMRGEIYTSDLLFSKTTPSIIFAAPIYDNNQPHRPILGVVIGNFNWFVVRQLFNEIDPIHQVYLLNSKWKTIATSSSQQIFLHKSLIDVDGINSILQRKTSGSMVLPSLINPQEDVFISYADQRGFLNYQGHHWILFIKTPLQIVFSPIYQVAQKIAFLSGIVGILLVGVFYIVGKTLTRPIEHLSQTMQIAGKGNLDVRAKIISTDEIGILAATFNQMTENLSRITVSKAYVEKVLASMIDTLIVINPDATIRILNQSVLTLLGYSEEELIGQNISTIIMEEEQKIFRGTGLEILEQKGFIRDQEVLYRTKKGDNIPMLISGSVMRDSEGQLEGIVCVAQDITERKEFQEMKRLNAKLKSTQAQLIQSGKLASLGELATGIAHEINQPLTYISTKVQILQLDIEKGRTDLPQVHTTLKAFKERIKRISAIIRHLRTLGRDQEMEFVRVNLSDVLENTLLLLSERMRLQNIQFHQDLERECPPLRGNPFQLEQVFINLIQNAIEVLEIQNGGHISIKAVRLPEQQKVEIQFSDSGPGVPSKFLERIFDPFYTTKQEGKGTGLGLSISYGIIQAHHGEMICHSQPDQGATFIITLPIEKML